MIEEGMTVFVDVRKAENRDADWKGFEDDVAEVVIDKIIDDERIDVYPTMREWGVVMFVERKHIIETYTCPQCDNDKLYHDNKEEFFCPWCNDD